MDWNYEEGRIYSVNENKELMAEATFVTMEDGTINIDHTYVNPALRGQRVAGKMMEVVATYLRKNHLKASATCPYANAWLKKRRDTHSDIIAKALDEG